ncbi:hypothetical protein [Paenibacillus sp. YYML68]|uniref:hypothetical protein n=1 Tax=Paenibacillus sp. YYML68 TaxID=2909250 RepID=UPI0024905D2C|nr:hypothetical protein [Paenibacillus sp. YYML68]
MNIRIEFTHFTITELLYKMMENDSKQFYKNTTDEEIDQITQGRLFIEKEMRNCFFQLVTDLKTSIKDEPVRKLELSVQFHFTIDHDVDIEVMEEKDEALKAIQEQFGGSILEFCKNRISMIIRQITSLDYQPPIINESVSVEINKQIKEDGL